MKLRDIEDGIGTEGFIRFRSSFVVGFGGLGKGVVFKRYQLSTIGLEKLILIVIDTSLVATASLGEKIRSIGVERWWKWWWKSLNRKTFPEGRSILFVFLEGGRWWRWDEYWKVSNSGGWGYRAARAIIPQFGEKTLRLITFISNTGNQSLIVKQKLKKCKQTTSRIVLFPDKSIFYSWKSDCSPINIEFSSSWGTSRSPWNSETRLVQFNHAPENWR